MLTIVAQSWQEIDGTCHYCHSWRDLVESMITAMTAALILLLTAAAVVAFGYLTARVLDGDGYGHRPPPASHPRDIFDPSNRPTRLA
ncbi:hypothetical protein K1X13_02240 [Nocardioides sp. WL0053]|uniref:Uncharacterized protein n=1 Tax=Nocardioides jiangsuensis TaxID=2866161 RepID=A0ABS7RGK1_9ACTN|nr:hypothetical protein [Nocardioides jiangsuensis]MBY9073632.1 hypothetical protein [Nocardioides jiangsuensis]